MKVPLKWVRKQLKFLPTTHCHPDPYILSKSCNNRSNKACISELLLEGNRQSFPTKQIIGLHLFDECSDGSIVKHFVEIKGLGSRSHSFSLHLQWHICIFYYSLAFQHLAFTVCQWKLGRRFSNPQRKKLKASLFSLPTSFRM